MSDLKSLLERVAKATGPDRKLDAALYDHFCSHATQEWTEWDSRNDFTHSIDTALALVNEKLPPLETADHSATEVRLQIYDTGCNATLDQDTFDGEAVYSANAKTAPIAILSALLHALIAQQEAKEGTDGR